MKTINRRSASATQVATTAFRMITLRNGGKWAWIMLSDKAPITKRTTAMLVMMRAGYRLVHESRYPNLTYVQACLYQQAGCPVLNRRGIYLLSHDAADLEAWIETSFTLYGERDRRTVRKFKRCVRWIGVPSHTEEREDG